VEKNRKDFILFQLDVALRDAGNDSTKKAEVVNRMAETISRINKAEDFTRQQDYIKQCAEILKIDEAGLHTLVNKFIRDRINTQERKTNVQGIKPGEEAGTTTETESYDDASFNLLFKDELHEKEIARVLLEYGTKKWDESRLVAEYIFEELPDDTLIENPDVLNLVAEFKNILNQNSALLEKKYFIYHSNPQLSSLAVSLLNFPYEESEHWKKEFNKSDGYQQGLFEQTYEEFINIVKRSEKERLLEFLKAEEDRTNEKVESAVNYLKLRKIKQLLLQNQADMEKEHGTEEQLVLHQTHDHLKKMEMELTRKMGTVVIR
ncbi:MAG: DNA primase, partial [Chitinophagaceae bacterium]|nr:DNA primase [Chitinophagaceae bacterium]